MIKVLMISTDAKIFDEGSEARLRMEEYGRLFEELHILVFTKKKFQTSFFSFENPAKISGNVHVYPTNSWAKIFYMPDGALLGSRIARRISREGKSVITCQDPFETGFVGARLSKKFGMPLHVQIHTDLFNPEFAARSVLNRLRVVVARHTLARAKAIRTVSERIRTSLGDSRASVLPIFSDIESIKAAPVPVGFKLTNMKCEKTVLVASRLTKEKDLETGLRAFALALESFPHIGLIIAGSGPQLEQLKSVASLLGIGDKIEWKSWLEKKELVSYMKTCDVFLSSSLYEGYGLSMLEAHAAGATLCATDAGIAKLLANDKCVASPKDVEGLTTALRNALSGAFVNKEYAYPYASREEYLDAYRKDVERAAGVLV